MTEHTTMFLLCRTLDNRLAAYSYTSLLETYLTFSLLVLLVSLASTKSANY